MNTVTGGAPEPGFISMRSDAARNQQRILAAADRLLVKRGVDITVDDIADEAGVGVGTVYRRFANKHELIRTIIFQYIAELKDVSAEACHVADPWRGIVHLLERTCELVAGNRGYNTAMYESDYSATFFDRFEEQCADVEQLLDRAQSDGVIRSGVVLADLFAIVAMVHAVAAFTSSVNPDNWRRYLMLLIDGLRPGLSSLGTPALTLDQMKQARTNAAANRRKF